MCDPTLDESWLPVKSNAHRQTEVKFSAGRDPVIYFIYYFKGFLKYKTKIRTKCEQLKEILKGRLKGVLCNWFYLKETLTRTLRELLTCCATGISFTAEVACSPKHMEAVIKTCKNTDFHIKNQCFSVTV